MRERRTCEDRRNRLPHETKPENKIIVIELRKNPDRRSGKDRRAAFG
jgi:hypothetical protein